MSIQKKSLISTLKTAKKANVASSSTHEEAKGTKLASMRVNNLKASTMKSFKKSTTKSFKQSHLRPAVS